MTANLTTKINAMNQDTRRVEYRKQAYQSCGISFSWILRIFVANKARFGLRKAIALLILPTHGQIISVPLLDILCIHTDADF